MMNENILRKIRKLQNDEIIVSKEPGNSMLPILKSNEPVLFTPITYNKCKKDDIVFCKVNGNCVTHKVYAVDKKLGVLIGNNQGHKNGWTKRVYGLAHPFGNEIYTYIFLLDKYKNLAEKSPEIYTDPSMYAIYHMLWDMYTACWANFKCELSPNFASKNKTYKWIPIKISAKPIKLHSLSDKNFIKMIETVDFYKMYLYDPENRKSKIKI